jgi:LmbE family N-acetylglucosaminyl deacetylase
MTRSRALSLWRRVAELALAACFALCACRTSPPRAVNVGDVARFSGPRVLAVIAHPDDETGFAATLYAIATSLDGACDICVITNGEGGFKYATLAERIYGCELTDEAIGRARLPAIRRRELEESASILGVRDLYFLDQKDHRYTTDAAEVLGPGAKVWDLELVRRELARIFERGRYDFVFALAPTAATHAHHKAATILALEVARSLPAEERPVVLCERTVEKDASEPLEIEPRFAVAELAAHEPFVFDRRQSFGFRGSLDYSIIVNLAIAAHKSQGTMQLAMNRGDREEFYLFADEPPGAEARASELFEKVRWNPFPSKTYGESAGTNAKP